MSGVANLTKLARHAASCRRCVLWENATQTVFGDGPPNARLMLVGEQPGDQEDLQGKPFVGPAGAVLRRALEEAGIDAAKAYVTNAVKHFKFVVQRGKRRIHQKPNVIEIEACRYWFEQELATIRPEMVVALGATAARAVFGREVAIQRNRGRIMPLGNGPGALITVHPSFLLRLPDEASRASEYALFVADLTLVAEYAELDAG
ncbi:MAG: UdgX family uracil-DNA binding protein [Rhodoplanes sp.]